VADPRDRRSLLAELTAEGRTLFRRIVAEQERQEAELFGELPAGDLQRLRDVLAAVMESCQRRLNKPGRRNAGAAVDVVGAVTPVPGGPAAPGQE
jgi:hypothetical protein